MSDEDYAAFIAAGGDGAAAEALLKKYLSKVRNCLRFIANIP